MLQTPISVGHDLHILASFLWIMLVIDQSDVSVLIGDPSHVDVVIAWGRKTVGFNFHWKNIYILASRADMK